MPLFSGQTRDDLRRVYVEAWRKFNARLPMEPLESQVAAVIVDHPEYLGWLSTEPDALSAEFDPADARQNPFLHLGLHLALREQVATDRPSGITAVYRALASRCGDAHAAEHAMLEPLAAALWEAQRTGVAPDEALYLQRLRAL